MIIKLKIMSNGYFNLNEVFAKIYKLGIQNILVECGNNLTNKILRLNILKN